jgi:hypothetical protein
MELTSVMMISKLKPSNRTGPFTACAMSMTAPKIHPLNTPTACASGRGVLYNIPISTSCPCPCHLIEIGHVYFAIAKPIWPSCVLLDFMSTSKLSWKNKGPCEHPGPKAPKEIKMYPLPSSTKGPLGNVLHNVCNDIALHNVCNDIALHNVCNNIALHNVCNDIALERKGLENVANLLKRNSQCFPVLDTNGILVSKREKKISDVLFY